MRKAIPQRVSVGEQPRQADLEELKKDGVTTVVNLRLAEEDSSLSPAEERAVAEKTRTPAPPPPDIFGQTRYRSGQTFTENSPEQSRPSLRSLWNGTTRMLVFASRLRCGRGFDFRTSA
jgi:protein tyrosine phosphatase (PTP) superfamily phosphohydrolase (DUF442 family)